jgi:uncharacterized membrane protein
MQEDPIKLWQHFHGASVHFALALALVSIAFDLGAMLLQKKEWRTVGFWSLIIAAVLSIPAVLSGLWGQLGWFKSSSIRLLNPGDASPWTADHLLIHRNFALAASIVFVLLTLWRCLTSDFGNGSRERKTGRFFVIYLVLMTIASGCVGYAGYLGGYVARGY